MPKVTRTRRADRDLEEIAVYIAGNAANAADELIDRFDEKFTLLAQFPYLGHDRPGFYRLRTDGIIVIRVIHGARNLRRIFRPK
jgi:plasmid stabilization system protein ParE